jgi:transposase
MTALSTVPPAAEQQFATVQVSLELSHRKWLASVSRSSKRKVSRYKITGGDLPGLKSLLHRTVASERERTDLSVRLSICFEAGRDGHWLYRALKAEGYEVFVVDPASVAVNRRARRAKSDGLDVDMLDRVLKALVRGETGICSVIRVPPPEVEDIRRIVRERERLIRERVSHVNRINELLIQHNIRNFMALRRDRLEQLEGLRCWNGAPLPAHLKAELVRECRRLALLLEMITEVEAERAELIAAGELDEAPAVQKIMHSLVKLKGIGPAFASVLACEVYYREFRNRGGVGHYTGLAPSPYDSGTVHREQGICKAGNARARASLVEAAWLWTRYQPGSALAQAFFTRVGRQKGRVKRIAVVALARKLAIALWRYVTTGLVPDGAELKKAA